MARRQPEARTASIAAGSAFVFVLGSLLHFAYAWSGNLLPAALVAAVNESTWEHLKIAFWPGLAWALMRCMRQAHPTSMVLSASGYGLLAVSLLIVVLFYGYVAVLGHNVLALDISIFLIAIVGGQLVAVRLMRVLEGKRLVTGAGLALLVAQTLAFSACTYWPPHHWLFQDPRNGGFGIAAGETGSGHAGR